MVRRSPLTVLEGAMVMLTMEETPMVAPVEVRPLANVAANPLPATAGVTRAGSLPLSIIETVSSGNHMSQNGSEARLLRCTGHPMATTGAVTHTDCVAFITESTGKSLRNASRKDISNSQTRQSDRVG